MPRGECIGGHFFDGAENFGCAYTEGFAQFASALAFHELYFDLYGRPARIAHQYSRVVNNEGYPGLPEHSNRPDYVDDGSIIEGPVSSFLWDLYDAPGTSDESQADEAEFDRTNYPLSYIGDVIRSCKWIDGRPRDEKGIDHLISCFENQRVPYSDTFFWLRYEDGVGNYGVSESATEPPDWEPVDIRRLWRKTLSTASAHSRSRSPSTARYRSPRTRLERGGEAWLARARTPPTSGRLAFTAKAMPMAAVPFGGIR